MAEKGKPEDAQALEDLRGKISEISLKMSSEHHGRYFGLGNWILATLVAINGAAIVSLSNLALPVLQGMVVPAAFYVSGVVAAVLSGFCHKGELDRLSAARFLDGMFGGRDVPEWGGDKKGLKRVAARLSTLSDWLNAVALLAFVVGCAAAGYKITHYPPAQIELPAHKLPSSGI